jgi:hypothetical protein
MTREVPDPPRPRLALVEPPPPLPPSFPLHARIRTAAGDEVVDVREIALGRLPEGTRSGPVQLLVGEAQPVVVSAELHVAPDGTAVLRPTPSNPNRNGFRVPVALPATVQRQYRRGTIVCATRNLSVVGALLDGRAAALRRGERVTLTIALPGGPVALPATVVHHDDAERAVRFDAYPSGAEAALGHFLSEVQRRELARRR